MRAKSLLRKFLMPSGGTAVSKLKVTLDDYHQVVESFHSESDRGAAVLAGSFAEAYLGKFLRSVLAPGANERELFSRSGALSNFASQIDCAHAFGFITIRTRDDLHRIRNIRNHFAHHPLIATFEEPKVLELLRKLSVASLVAEGGGALQETSARDLYISAIGLFVASAHNELARVQAQQESERGA